MVFAIVSTNQSIGWIVKSLILHPINLKFTQVSYGPTICIDAMHTKQPGECLFMNLLFFVLNIYDLFFKNETVFCFYVYF